MKFFSRIQEKTYSYDVLEGSSAEDHNVGRGSYTGLECKYFPKKTLDPDQVPHGGKKRGSGLWLR